MMARRIWTRDELLVAGFLYCRMPFGRFYSRYHEIVRVAQAMGRTPAALAMKLSNLTSVDPAFRLPGRSGLAGASANASAHAGSFFESAIRIYEGQPIAVPEKFSPAAEFLAHHRGEISVG